MEWYDAWTEVYEGRPLYCVVDEAGAEHLYRVLADALAEFPGAFSEDGVGRGLSPE